MENGTPSSSSDSEMASKENKNRRSKLKKKCIVILFKNKDDALFKNRSKNPLY